jgi:hypothetical protein
VDLAVSASVPAANRPAHLPNQFLFRKSILLDVALEPRRIAYLFDDRSAYGQGSLAEITPLGTPPVHYIDLESPNGFRGRLVLRLSTEYEDTGLSRFGRGVLDLTNSGTARRVPKEEKARKKELVEEPAIG